MTSSGAGLANWRAAPPSKEVTTMAGPPILERAGHFIWRNARLLERQQFAYLFAGGRREAVVAALGAYQNTDGGFGNALEPDKRCPDSQPVDAEMALRVLADVGADEADAPMLRRLGDYLTSITTAEGGAPFALPSI